MQKKTVNLNNKLKFWTNKLEDAKREGNCDMILLATRKIERINCEINTQPEY